MHSLYRKQLAMMVSIVALSFTLLSAAFIHAAHIQSAAHIVIVTVLVKYKEY